MSDTWVPVDVCTLPTADIPLRVAEFDDLFAAALTDVDQPSPTTLELSLLGPIGLAARVRDLTDRESDCCSFFSFTLTQISRGSGQRAGRRDDAEQLQLDVAVPAVHADVLTAVAQRASHALVSRNTASSPPAR